MLTINKTYCISSDDKMTIVIYLNKENDSYNLCQRYCRRSG